MIKLKDAIRILDAELTKSYGNYRYQNPQKLDREEALYVAIQALQGRDGREQGDDGWKELECDPCGDIGQRALVFPVDDEIDVGEYLGEGEWRVGDFRVDWRILTHWRPLPKPPQAREGVGE